MKGEEVDRFQDNLADERNGAVLDRAMAEANVSVHRGYSRWASADYRRRDGVVASARGAALAAPLDILVRHRNR
jgi:hypothetical protein